VFWKIKPPDYYPICLKKTGNEWRNEAQEGHVVDLDTALGPGDKSRFPGPPSTPTQAAHVELMHVMRILEGKTNGLTETLDNVKLRLGKHDKEIIKLKQTYRDTDENADSDMFGASARPTYNPSPYSKHHLVSMTVLKPMMI